MKNFLDGLKSFLEKIDHYRDKVFFLFIKPYWPRRISPNQITYVRVLIGVGLFVLLFLFGIEDKPIVIFLFCFGVFTDLLDGSVARGLNKITDLGIMLDPLADRILILPIAFYSLYEHHKLLLLLIILVELVNALTVVFYKSKETNVGANIFGKTRMVLMSVVFIVILIVWPQEPPLFFIDLIWISLIFSCLSIFTRILELKDLGHIKNKFVNKELNKIHR